LDPTAAASAAAMALFDACCKLIHSIVGDCDTVRWFGEDIDDVSGVQALDTPGRFRGIA
jgi:hypothetical protein